MRGGEIARMAMSAAARPRLRDGTPVGMPSARISGREKCKRIGDFGVSQRSAQG